MGEALGTHLPSSRTFQSYSGDGAIKRSNQRGRPQDKRPPMNERITEEEVRLIDADGEQLGVVPTTEALERAEAAGLDLVQISNADPIVCKIMDYGKFVFE